MALNILDESIAKEAYSELLKIINQPKRLHTDKIIDIGVIIERIYTEITKNSLSVKDDLLKKIDFVKNNYNIPSDIIKNSHEIRKKINDRRHSGTVPKTSFYPTSIETVMECVNFYSGMKIPTELQNAYDNFFTPREESEPKDERSNTDAAQKTPKNDSTKSQAKKKQQIKKKKKNKDIEDPMSVYQKGIHLFNNAKSNTNTGEQKTQILEEAWTCFNKVINARPDFADAYLYRARVHNELSNKALAIIDLKIAIKHGLSPKDRFDARNLLIKLDPLGSVLIWNRRFGERNNKYN